MNNKISNPKQQVPTGLSLNEKDYITSLLTCLKDIEKNYVIAMTEASNEHLYQQYHDMFCNLASLQRETYEVMFQKGWYSLEKAEAQKINEKAQMLTTEKQNLFS